MLTTLAKDLPEETKALVAALRKPRWHVVTGATLNITPKLEAAETESEESKAIKRHLLLWEKFRDRLAKRPKLIESRPHLGPMIDDIRNWEAAKAGVNLADERRVMPHHQSLREWFMGTSAAGRVELVKAERLRRADERRFELRRRRRNIELQD